MGLGHSESVVEDSSDDGKNESDDNITFPNSLPIPSDTKSCFFSGHGG